MNGFVKCDCDIPTECPADEQVATKADCAVDAAEPEHMVARAAWTLVALSLPQIAFRSEGSCWVLWAVSGVSE